MQGNEDFDADFGGEAASELQPQDAPKQFENNEAEEAEVISKPKKKKKRKRPQNAEVAQARDSETLPPLFEHNQPA